MVEKSVSTLTSRIQDFTNCSESERCSVPSQLGTYARIPLRSSSSSSIYLYLRKSRGGHCGWVACFSFGDIEGAKILGIWDSRRKEKNLSLILVESGKGKETGQYTFETRMDELPVMSLIKELNIDKSRIPGVSHKFHCLECQDDRYD